MSRLSDRTYRIVKNEIERRYSDHPENQSERVQLLGKLQALHRQPGKPITSLQLWEELSDIAPNFDYNLLLLLIENDRQVKTTKSAWLGAGASVGMGGAIAVLFAAATGIDPLSGQTTLSLSSASGSTTSDQKHLSDKEALHMIRRSTSHSLPALVETNDAGSALAMAKKIGWQAALKSQNPPHSAEHWAQTAQLWQQAIAYLERVPSQAPNYSAAQAKKAEYQQNLQQIEARKRIAQAQMAQAQPALGQLTPAQPAQTQTTTTGIAPAKIGAIAPTANQFPQFSDQPEPLVDNALASVKQYGWQAALASQNAPHPPEKWADISRLWQIALKQIDTIDTQHPQYAEAQQVKTRYQNNLAIVRQRYQQAQNASQRLQSLQASLSEIETTAISNAAKYSQLQSIVQQLQTIPSATVAHTRAQQLIVQTRAEMNLLSEHPSSQLVLSLTD